jgi:cysteinyl-tRNA synthetase
MSMKYLGETFDLHCGGVDLVFPHHENEIAQSEGGTGRPFVRHWMHVEHLLVEGETMSKSKGNFFTVPDLLARGERPDAIRYLLGQVHYRKQLNFTFEGLAQARAALDRIHGFYQRLGEVDTEGDETPAVRELAEGSRRAFREALAADLNTSEALAAVHVMVNEGNARLAAGGLSRGDAGCLRGLLEEFDRVFAVFRPAGEDRLTPEEASLLEARQEARRRRDFAAADAARARLLGLGVVLEDTPGGTRWRRRR